MAGDVTISTSLYESLIDEDRESSPNWGDSLVTVQLSRASETRSSCGSLQGAEEDQYEPAFADGDTGVAETKQNTQYEVRSRGRNDLTLKCCGYFNCPFESLAAEAEAYYCMGLLSRLSRLPPV